VVAPGVPVVPLVVWKAAACAPPELMAAWSLIVQFDSAVNEVEAIWLFAIPKT
jgi:hypothetical protein